MFYANALLFFPFRAINQLVKVFIKQTGKLFLSFFLDCRIILSFVFVCEVSSRLKMQTYRYN